MRRSDMEHAQPRLARLARQRLIEPGVLLVATVRSDGSPRISAVEPLVLDGALWLGMMWQSAKARDLLRDPRILVHSIVTGREAPGGEFKIRGAARAGNDPATFQRYASTVAGQLGWRPGHGQMHLFEVDLSEVTFIAYETETGGQHVAMWPPPREFVRPGVTATSLGDPEPAAGILAGARRLSGCSSRPSPRRRHRSATRSPVPLRSRLRPRGARGQVPRGSRATG